MTCDRSAPDVSYDELLSMMPPALRDALVITPWRLERLHRLAKALMEERSTVDAIRLSPADVRTIST